MSVQKFVVRVYSDHAIVNGELVEPISKLGAFLVGKAGLSKPTTPRVPRKRRTKAEIAEAREE